ncbi:MAG TPA: hypothetical protein PLD20_21950 [Blastocatellia bacterium]|nr:hypothetical protein [Blastocatellia bacterium]HMV83618.1 hypothetical protein [Blastocatellia bacterium]HMX26989.1 hypothetical protein [Blastocatellia bacterium]HMZ20617.1 hypothetical protein [Blastocatellia bacterium]HNG28409.1 hypothetical protein [Blastocatellia bacterium]
MKYSKLLLSLFACLVVLFALSIAVLADTVKLRDGSVLKGKVVSYGQGKFTILVYIGGKPSQHVISVDEIESVEFDGADAIAGGTNTSRSSLPPVTAEVPRNAATLPAEKPVTESNPPVTSAPAANVGGGAQNDNDTGVIATIAEKTVSVAAGADWTSSEIRVQRGQRIVITAVGDVDLGDNHRTGPDGITLADKDKLMADQPTGALIAVIGDDNNDFVFVGQSTEFVAKHNGILFLSVNEGNLKDNNGAFVARVKVLSNR